MAGSDKQVVAYLYASLSCGDTGARDSQAALFGIGHYTLLFLPLCLPVSELQQPESEIWDEGPRPQGEQIDNPDVAGFRANRTRLGFSAGHMKQTSRRAELSARS